VRFRAPLQKQDMTLESDQAMNIDLGNGISLKKEDL
jgi:hypothetical protein